jgi:hypothetical protein
MVSIKGMNIPPQRYSPPITSWCVIPKMYLLRWLRLTVRREKRRQQFYGHAYSKIDGKLHNIYLGKQDRLTQARLEHACLLIDQRARKESLHCQCSDNTAS